MHGASQTLTNFFGSTMLFTQLTCVMLNLFDGPNVHLNDLFCQDMLIIQIWNECQLHIC